MSKAEIEQFTDAETAQRRDAIVRAMVNMLPQPRVAERPAKPRGEATPTVSGREPENPDADAKGDAAA